MNDPFTVTERSGGGEPLRGNDDNGKNVELDNHGSGTSSSGTGDDGREYQVDTTAPSSDEQQ